MALTDFEVEMEIKKLQQDEYVKLAQKENRLKKKRRLYLSHLRCDRKRGMALAKQGITLENMKSRLFPEGEEETEGND